jgi:hypothetical protein
MNGASEGAFKVKRFYSFVHLAYEGVFLSDYGHLSTTLSVGTPLCPYGIVYGRFHRFSNSGLFTKSLCSPLCGWMHHRETSCIRLPSVSK